ncbi:MAG TPA: bifunctional riboflavin kinase/FAD synthetase [Methylotenera sp.]|mgnify:CR=1 FL=1|nr:bifunctional riboflavin kinase/FAD synthetase [Methylotenera sp.]HPH05580.1 bifunctional riboflavin kinase/FAD synthetase [Methylotenera sp.]HPN00006.1 bifunctional riboflavin kinase/FAD synthetase [Methylotenera sp.]
MQIFRHLPEQTKLKLAIAIGNFDGLHLGHQVLLARLIEVAKTQNLTPTVMTFEPHPREFFTPQNAPARLSTLREKLEHFKQAGVAQVFVCRFNQAFAQISAQAFMSDILRKKLNASTVLVGEDFRFGAKRAGSVTELRENGFDLISPPQVQQNNERVSSTRVRNALAAGDLTQAATLLDRPYSISGKVVHGAKRGRQLGFPTANVHMRHERPPMTGVYAVKLDGLNAVANLGVRPTIAGVPKMSLEVHVLDYQGDLYNKHVHVEFLHKIRDEMKFNGLDALTAQITADVSVAREFFSRT